MNTQSATNFTDPNGPPNVSWYYDDPDYWTLVPGGRSYSAEEKRLIIKYKGFPPEKFVKAPNYVASKDKKAPSAKKRGRPAGKDITNLSNKRQKAEDSVSGDVM